MKNLKYYSKKGLNGYEYVFNYFLDNLKDSIFSWDYFVDFKKVVKNIKKSENEISFLNKLIGISEYKIEDEFLKLIIEKPSIRKILPELIAVRLSKIKDMPIVTDKNILNSSNKSDLFNPNVVLDDKMKKELVNFFSMSGLKKFFINSEISNLNDYCKGIEVGLDTNGRKNRTGTSMEILCEQFIKDLCKKKNYKYISQATKAKILSSWGINIKIEKINRRFDFAILDNKKKLTLIEVNFYSGSGSKLKSTAGEYKELNAFLVKNDYKFIWITDGKGWNTSKTSLKETFLDNDYVFNLKMISEGILEEVI